ncbi:protein of unknown function [Candidatus Hydrogenisulfobacillus filiaventi]|uniref:Uncharacterized protein n=1 Tax=Candidatus Hydrogenisulfobacillus filiaventi TaxID=2707344 RepID=A0A6F8ZD12_9FIRM|nr:protein of unknown function [Candidatus Hydrogenisulfobacillus filiaventi]
MFAFCRNGHLTLASETLCPECGSTVCAYCPECHERLLPVVRCRYGTPQFVPPEVCPGCGCRTFWATAAH